MTTAILGTPEACLPPTDLWHLLWDPLLESCGLARKWKALGKEWLLEGQEPPKRAVGQMAVLWSLQAVLPTLPTDLEETTIPQLLSEALKDPFTAWPRVTPLT